MGKINVLSFEIANLIAAGEVVERPASVVKELIENSIDAGATKIVAEIKHGGVALIRVTDNGCGISREDLPIALKRHATSKIHEKDDLASIMTLGFRGEALAAISSVSAVTILTKTRDSDTAYMLTSEPGTEVEVSEVGAADGTTVVVERLFFNVPARRKFLKKDATEAMNVTALVEKVALSHPEISIQLLVDGEEKFRTPGSGVLADAVRAVLGRDFAAALLPVDSTVDGIRVHGFIGRSDNVRKNRNFENVFINGRYVKSVTVMTALEKAFVSYIAPECFPSCVLFLSMSPGSVDVNVHPAKLEVKFSDERPVFEAVYHTVRAKLEEGGYRPDFPTAKTAPQYSPKSAFIPIGEKISTTQIRMDPAPVSHTPDPRVSAPAPSYKRENVSNPTAPSRNVNSSFHTDTMSPRESVSILEKYSRTPAKQDSERTLFVASPATHLTEEPTQIAPPAAMPDTPAPSAEREPASTPPAPRSAEDGAGETPVYRLIGEAFDTYVFVELADEMLILDKHAAHERVIFEDLKASRREDGRVASQQLLFPLDVALTKEEYSALDEYRSDVLAVGFDYTLDPTCAHITAIPDLIGSSDAMSLLLSMADDLSSGRSDPATTEALRRERALYQVACKAAIKGGRKYDEAVLHWLIKKVLSLPNITVCPHGRPIAYRMSKRELDRNFDRIK